jgi:lysozyme family protein
MRYLLPAVLKLSTANEGGYSNHKKDPGGPTNHGVTQATYSSFLGRKASIAEVQAMTLETANKIYERSYWAPIWGDQLPAGLDYAVFDFGINSGPSRAVKELQGLLPGIAIDGLMGQKTLDAIKAFDASELIKGLCNARLRFMKKLRTWKTFGRGWTYRVTGIDPNRQYPKRNGVIGDALAMVARKPVTLLPFPLDDLLPLAKARDVDQSIFAPLGNKIQGGIVGSVVGGGALTQLPNVVGNLIPGLQQAKDSLETVKDVSQTIAYILGFVTVILALLTIMHTLQKARESGLNT